MINAWVEKGRIKASYRDSAGVLSIRDLGEAHYTGFVKDPDVVKSCFGVIDVSRDKFADWYRVLFVDYDSRKDFLINNPGVIFEADVSPVRRFITDHKVVIDPPKRGFMDEETDSRASFTEAIVGETTLLTWAFVDDVGASAKQALEDMHDQAEAELWAELWRQMGTCDSVIAWNGERFDFAVMKFRCERLAKKYPKIMQPYWEHRRRLLFVDHLLCFKRHHMAAESGDDKTSMRLGDVCESIIGEGKNDFDSSKTYEAWAAGGSAREELLAYNLQDTALLPKLEEATGYLALQQAIAEITWCPVNTHTLKPMPWIDAYLLKMAHRRGTHLPSKLPGGGDVKDVQGAIVMAPTKLGVHEDVHVVDFKSLYPTIIRTFNLGSETKLSPEEGQRRWLAGDPFVCKAATGVYFQTDKPSMLSEFCSEMMNTRDFWKKEMKKYPPGTPEWKYAERMSKGGKIANNSGFGVNGNPYFRLYDTDVTEAIIQGARLMLMSAKAAAESWGMEMIYGDTDSLFIVGCPRERFEEFVRYCNAEVFPKVLAEHRCRKEFCVVELAYEKQFSRLVFPCSPDGTPAAKRYAGAYRHYGGKEATADSKPEIRGLEFMRTDAVRLARHMQREAIEMILTGRPEDEIEAWVKRKRELFFEGEVPLEDIVLSKGISRSLDAYRTKGPHVRIAEALAEAGEDVGEGTRISYVVTDGTVSPTQVIAAGDYKGEFDRHYYWSKSIYPCVMRVLVGAYPNRPWKRWIPKRPKKTLPGQLALLSV
jgi:DNA polymerase elongation subunit (family B)